MAFQARLASGEEGNQWVPGQVRFPNYGTIATNLAIKGRREKCHLWNRHHVLLRLLNFVMKFPEAATPES